VSPGCEAGNQNRLIGSRHTANQPSPFAVEILIMASGNIYEKFNRFRFCSKI
jgi:hypothetical protein